MLWYNDGWLFVGLDGLLYSARFSPEGNGIWGDYWDIDEVRLEWWHRIWPLPGCDS